MKKYLSLLLALVLLLPGCGKRQDEKNDTTGQNAETITRVTLAFLEENGEADALIWYLEPTETEDYITDYYKLEDLNLLDGAIVRMEGARAFELAVLQVEKGDVETVTAALQEYLTDRRASFTGYLPDQAELIDSALILNKGEWIALVVCQNQEYTRSGFESCFGEGVNAVGSPAILGPDQEDYRPDGRLIYQDPGVDDMTLFDSSAILTAWESGDNSALSREDRQVLNAAKAVFDQYITPDMSDYDKELTLYTWLTTHVNYDRSHYEKKGAPRTSYEPYGPLVGGKGVCLGYAETFRLFMDMAGIECITVTGAAFQNRENHAWNMVKLNGEWYCADPTWDLIGLDETFEEVLSFIHDLAQTQQLNRLYSYFNVTSDWMAGTNHQWDYDSVPEATAEDFGRP